MKKSSGRGIIELLLSIGIILIFHFFYFKIFNLLNINLNGIMYEIANFIKYVLMSVIIFIIYRSNINSGKNKFNSSLVNSLIYSVACFVVLILITVLLHKGINMLSDSTGFIHTYNFNNYFNNSFSISTILSLIIDAIFIPFLICVIFPLGISNIISSKVGASFISGLLYGIFYIVINTSGISLINGILLAIVPFGIIFFLTYLYKTNGNIFTVMITYSIYILFGTFAINYVLG